MNSSRSHGGKRRRDDPPAAPERPPPARRWPWLAALGVVLASWGGLELARTRNRAAGPAPAVSVTAPSTAPARTIRTWRTSEGKPGPWGRLEYTRISIEPPDQFLPDAEIYLQAAHWVFPDLSAEQVDAKLSGLGLDRVQVEQLRATWTVGSDGVIVTPPADLIVGLAPEVRKRLYAELSLERANLLYQAPSVVRPEFLDERLETAGLSPSTVSLFKGLLYQRGSWTLFSDLPAMLQRVPEPGERRRLIAMSLRNSTFMVRLRLDEHSDLASIVRYWDFPGRAKDLEPLLRSLMRVPGGYELDLAHLLPPMPRRRIYTYPPPSDDCPGFALDCYWTSLNFFATTTDDAFKQPQRAVAQLRTDYHRVEPPYLYGDVVLMSSAQTGRPVHAAVHLADGLLFTKNGASSRQPWMVMTMDDAESYYHSLLRSGDRLEITVYRPNER